MPFRHWVEVFTPEDLALVQKIFEQTVRDTATVVEREAHAAKIITLFKNGRTTEDLLIKALSGEEEA